MTLTKTAGPKGAKLAEGFTAILSADKVPEVGLSYGVCKLGPGKSFQCHSDEMETAVLVFSGKGELISNGRTFPFERTEWIDHPPVVVHCCASGSIEVRNSGLGFLEVFVVQTLNPRSFSTRFYSPQDIEIEHRGKGILKDTCYRIVRLVFDDQSGPPESQMVLGEVVNFPGRWSSYPPHSHSQPEIYYYRFSPASGYGHAELGEEVFKIQDGDLLTITDNRVHAQVSAPGYHMYYLWAIRHLKDNRYTGFTFDPVHAWTLKKGSKS